MCRCMVRTARAVSLGLAVATLPTSLASSPTTRVKFASVETSIFAESALIDKETGRIYWEGGSSSTLSETLEYRLVQARASIVSLILWFAIYGLFSTWLRNHMDRSDIINTLQKNAFAALPVTLVKWVLLGAPRLDVWLLATIVALYFAEAYFSSTHKFLSNRADFQDVEAYIEKLREEDPEVVWKLRAFHYTPPAWLQPRTVIRKLVSNFSTKRMVVGAEDKIQNRDDNPVSWYPFRQKRVSHEATDSFKYNNGWLDKTTAGVWTRAQAETGTAPLAKIRLTKVLVLGDRKARDEYFNQQSRFVVQNKKQDDLAEFATSIHISGFKPRVLVVRRGTGRVLFSRRAFWLCTALGFTVFYRLWIERHCDEIRVSVIKETVSSPGDKSSLSSWFTTSSRSVVAKEEYTTKNNAFRTLMQQLDLYRTINASTEDLADEHASITDDLPSNITSIPDESDEDLSLSAGNKETDLEGSLEAAGTNITVKNSKNVTNATKDKADDDK